MIRARFVFAATLVGASLAAGSASAQAPVAPDFTNSPVRTSTAVRGAADVEFTKPVKRDGDRCRHKIKERGEPADRDLTSGDLLQRPAPSPTARASSTVAAGGEVRRSRSRRRSTPR
jgi:hypothetical protein